MIKKEKSVKTKTVKKEKIKVLQRIEKTVLVPANIILQEEGDNTYSVWIDGEHYDNVAPPVGKEKKVLKLIKKYGTCWASNVPVEWML